MLAKLDRDGRTARKLPFTTDCLWPRAAMATQLICLTSFRPLRVAASYLGFRKRSLIVHDQRHPLVLLKQSRGCRRHCGAARNDVPVMIGLRLPHVRTNQLRWTLKALMADFR